MARLSRCTKQDLWERLLLIIKQLEEHELMEFVLPDKKMFILKRVQQREEIKKIIQADSYSRRYDLIKALHHQIFEDIGMLLWQGLGPYIHNSQYVPPFVQVDSSIPILLCVFRSELIAIYEALKSIKNINYQDIWILTDSRSAIQHLSHTGELRDKVNRNISKNLKNSPSMDTLTRNEAADVLAKKGTKEPLPRKKKLTFKEIETVAKTKINKNWRIPLKHSWYIPGAVIATQTSKVHKPAHSWYSGVNPGGALNIRNRQHQTTLTRFRTGHLKPLNIEDRK
ncbi:TBC1D20 [Cordylochernes scorpioides]|uniref:TBC1D20 n=1 Tax=Cordylochernes scorpioides TaxID=51811 RepID=A0ABY6KF55_9ARAC|nr:TBC1D20 [Cordylochernes scorpioides]